MLQLVNMISHFRDSQHAIAPLILYFSLILRSYTVVKI